jgi:hypothetical protein
MSVEAIKLLDGEDLFLLPYKKAVVVYGQTSAHSSDLRELGGKWNSKIDLKEDGCCWVFQGKDRDRIVAHFKSKDKPVVAAAAHGREIVKLAPEIYLADYRREVVVYGTGQTDRYQGLLKRLGGRWNPNLDMEESGCCWVFPASKREEVVKAFRDELGDSVAEDAPPEELAPNLYMVPYKKAIVVYGKTGDHEEALKSLDGRWNPNIKIGQSGCCWVFRGSDRQRLIDKFSGPKSVAPPKEEPTRVVADAPPEELAPNLYMVPYKRAIVVYGETGRHREQLLKLGGKWNSKIALERESSGCCWVFPGKDRQRVVEAFRQSGGAIFDLTKVDCELCGEYFFDGKDTEKVVVLTPCLDIFHLDCFLGLDLGDEGICPLCQNGYASIWSKTYRRNELNQFLIDYGNLSKKVLFQREQRERKIIQSSQSDEYQDILVRPLISGLMREEAFPDRECELCGEMLLDDNYSYFVGNRMNLAQINPCGHIFHRICLEDFLMDSDENCPLDQQPFTEVKPFRLTLKDFEKIDSDWSDLDKHSKISN